MKVAAIIGAIVFAWCSGAAVDSSENPQTNTGAVVMLLLALVCGYLAWRL